MKNELISIVIPIFNKKKFLKSCLNSVLKQTYENIEIILVNDGSNDGSDEICYDYASKDKRIIVINQQNNGVSSARNTGIEVSKGKYLLFIDADDQVFPEYVERLYFNLINSSSDIIFCSRKEALYKKDRINKKIDYILEYHKGNIWEDFERLYYSNGIPFGGVYLKIYNAELIKKKKIRFKEELISGEDYIFNLEYFESIKTYCSIPDILYIYNIYDRCLFAKNVINEKRIVNDKKILLFTKSYISNHMLPPRILVSVIIGVLKGVLQVVCKDKTLGIWGKYKFYSQICDKLGIREQLVGINKAINKKQFLVLISIKHKMSFFFFIYNYLIIKKYMIIDE